MASNRHRKRQFLLCRDHGTWVELGPRCRRRRDCDHACQTEASSAVEGWVPRDAGHQYRITHTERMYIDVRASNSFIQASLVPARQTKASSRQTSPRALPVRFPWSLSRMQSPPVHLSSFLHVSPTSSSTHGFQGPEILE
jgi:hypothetical protein